MPLAINLRGRIAIVTGGGPRLAVAAEVVAKTIADLGGLHILVNNAGVELPEPLIDTTKDEYDRMMATNLKSMVLFSRAAGVHLIAGGSAASST